VKVDLVHTIGVYSSRRGAIDIEHIESARDDAEFAALKAVAAERLACWMR
jgi:hypothetical protein